MKDFRKPDDLLTALFNEEKLKNEKDGSYMLEPYLNETHLRSLEKERKERKLIIFMATTGMALMDFSFALIISRFIPMASWMIFVMAFLLLFMSGAIILMFYGLNKLVQNKEVMNL